MVLENHKLYEMHTPTKICAEDRHQCRLDPQAIAKPVNNLCFTLSNSFQRILTPRCLSSTLLLPTYYAMQKYCILTQCPVICTEEIINSFNTDIVFSTGGNLKFNHTVKYKRPFSPTLGGERESFILIFAVGI